MLPKREQVGVRYGSPQRKQGAHLEASEGNEGTQVPDRIAISFSFIPWRRQGIYPKLHLHTQLYTVYAICIYIYIDIILYNMSWYDAITFCRHRHEQVRTHSLLMRNCRFDSVVFRQEVEGWKIHGDGSLFLLA